MKRFTFLAAAAAMLVACSDVTRTPTSPQLVPSLNEASAEVVAGWSGGDLGTSEVDAQQAQHFRGFLCGVPTGAPSPFPRFIPTFDSHTTISSSGNAQLTCKGELPAFIPPPEGGAVVLRDAFPCGTQGGPATDSHAVITPSGNIILKCFVKP